MNIAVITARINSSRIPAKVLTPICGRPILDWIYERLRKAKQVHRICLATPSGQENRTLWDWSYGKCYLTTGKEDDVLDRLNQAGWEHNATKVVRITGDLPFLSYEGIDAILEALGPDVDYVNNVYGRRPWLDGANAEAAWFDAIGRANRMTPCEEGHEIVPGIRVDGTWRSHGLHWMANSPDFKKRILESEHDVSDLPKLLVDEPVDVKVAELVMEEVLKSGDDSYVKLLEIAREKKSAIERLRAS